MLPPEIAKTFLRPKARKEEAVGGHSHELEKLQKPRGNGGDKIKQFTLSRGNCQLWGVNFTTETFHGSCIACIISRPVLPKKLLKRIDTITSTYLSSSRGSVSNY